MKRIATILLPDLACELARQREDLDGRPFAITVDDNGESVADVDSGAILDAVDSLAWRYGARPGQSAAEAMAFVGNLHVVRLPLADVAHALASVAELALSYGTVASIADGTSISDGTATRDDRRRTYPGGGGAGPFDTVWLDVTGCARLVGGEDLLCAELSERVAALGHRSRVAVAPGPRIGRAVACWHRPSEKRRTIPWWCLKNKVRPSWRSCHLRRYHSIAIWRAGSANWGFCMWATWRNSIAVG